MTSQELSYALKQHGDYLASQPGGRRFVLGRRSLRGRDLRGRDLRLASFRFGDLTDAQLDYCDCTRADFRSATLAGCGFQQTSLAGAAFVGATLNWHSPDLVGGYLYARAKTIEQQRLAAWIGHSLLGPWPNLDLLEMSPEWPWALRVLTAHAEATGDRAFPFHLARV